MKLQHVIVSFHYHWAKTTFCLRLMKAMHHLALIQRSSISKTVPCLLRVTQVSPELHHELLLMGRLAWLVRGARGRLHCSCSTHPMDTPWGTGKRLHAQDRVHKRLGHGKTWYLSHHLRLLLCSRSEIREDNHPMTEWRVLGWQELLCKNAFLTFY